MDRSTMPQNNLVADPKTKASPSEAFRREEGIEYLV